MSFLEQEFARGNNAAGVFFFACRAPAHYTEHMRYLLPVLFSLLTACADGYSDDVLYLSVPSFGAIGCTDVSDDPDIIRVMARVDELHASLGPTSPKFDRRYGDESDMAQEWWLCSQRVMHEIYKKDPIYVAGNVLLGIHYRGQGVSAISEYSRSPRDRLNTIAHEYLHALGYPHENEWLDKLSNAVADELSAE